MIISVFLLNILFFSGHLIISMAWIQENESMKMISAGSMVLGSFLLVGFVTDKLKFMFSPLLALNALKSQITGPMKNNAKRVAGEDTTQSFVVIVHRSYRCECSSVGGTPQR